MCTLCNFLVAFVVEKDLNTKNTKKLHKVHEENHSAKSNYTVINYMRKYLLMCYYSPPVHPYFLF